MLRDDQIDPLKFTSIEDVVQKLRGTIVIWKDDPVYVSNILDKSTVCIQKFPGEPDAVPVKISEIDYSSPKLGLYFSTTYNSAVMPLRNTMRQYKGGLPPESIRSMECNRSGYMASRKENNTRDLFSNNFKSMLKNQYPTVSEVLNTLRSNPKIQSVPFRRFHWIFQDKSRVSMMFKDNLLVSYDYKTKVFEEPDANMDYQQVSLLSTVLQQVEEFKSYVRSV